MSNVIFAKTRHFYQDYEDVYRLAELSGYPVAYVDEVDWADASLTVIATPKHPKWDRVIPANHKCRLIWWTLERGHTDEPRMDMSNPFKPDYVDEVWASDRAFAETIGARFVFLGGHKGFGAFGGTEKRYDYITLMAPFGRRIDLLTGLAARSLRCADAEGGTWGLARHKGLLWSKLMVSCHQDLLPWSEPIRFMIGACYGLPILSEVCEDTGLYSEASALLEAPLKDMPGVAAQMVADEVICARLGRNAWKLCCVDHPFRREVELAL